jgi:hypothetical protein
MAGGVLTVSAVTSGVVEIGQQVKASGLGATRITGFGTGTGGVGTYTLDTTYTKTSQSFSLVNTDSVTISANATATATAQTFEAISTDEWNKISFASALVSADAATNGYPPAWATHIVILLEAVNCGGLFEMYLDDFMGARL